MAYKSNLVLNARAKEVIPVLESKLAGISIVAQGVQLTGKGAAARLRAHLDLADELRKTKNKVALLTKRHRKSRVEVESTLLVLKTFALASYPTDSAELVALRLHPRPRKKMTPATKVLAAEKKRATRKARNTLGRKQRSKIKAAPVTAVTVKGSR
jgi:hypothetical protein